jgi:predicted transcriptional regulator
MSKGGIDLRTLSDANRIHVLKIIHEQKSISRTELAGMTGLSLSAVSRIVKQLIEDGFVWRRVTATPAAAGSHHHRVNPLAGYVIGVDFSKTRPMPGYSTSAVR